MSDIHVYSHKRSNNFTIVPNHIINASYLKLEERMFLIWALSKPESWQLNYKSIATMFGISNNKVATISKSLQEHNHLIIKRENCGKTHWCIFEEQEDCKMHKCTLDEKVGKNSECTPTGPNAQPHSQNEIKPQSPQPSLAQESALVRTDLLERTDKNISASENAHVEKESAIEYEFIRLWDIWPNKKNKKRAIKDFNKLVKPLSSTQRAVFTSNLIQDVQQRIKTQQLGFKEMMLSTYLNGERWQDDYSTPDGVLDHNDTQWADNIDLEGL